MKSQSKIELADGIDAIMNSFPILNKSLLLKMDENGSVYYLDKDNIEQILL